MTGAGAGTGETRVIMVTHYPRYLLVTQVGGAGVDKVGEDQEQGVADSLLVG